MYQPAPLKPFLLERSFSDAHSRVSVAQNRPAASLVFDKDVGEPALRLWNTYQVRFHTVGAEFALMQIRIVVRSGRADIPRS
jgi:hypothetical protein